MADIRKVIVDSDFMNYMVRSNDREVRETCFEKIMNDLNIEPYIHEFLYEKEVMSNPLVRRLKEDGLLKVLEFGDILACGDETYYGLLFEDLYTFCNHRKLNLGRKNFRTYQESGANLGEIHSVIASMFLGYELFLSNDRGSKTMAKVKINTGAYRLNVMNVMDVMREIAQMPNKTMTKKEFDAMTRGDSGRKDEIAGIKQMWVGQ